MSKAILGIVIVALVVVGGGLLITSRQANSPEPVSNSESSSPDQASVSKGGQSQAPDFKLKDYQGQAVTLADFKDVPLVINAWAAWCPFCKEELKEFAQVQDGLKGKVVIIAVDRAESLNVAKKFSDELGVTDRLIMLLDPVDSFYRAIGGFSMPETIFVSKDGFIVDHKRGPMKAEEVKQRIQKIL